jgi:hypothetical protein
MTNHLNEHIFLNALDNEDNESIMKLDKQKIMDDKNNILQKLQLDREKLKIYHTKLKDYRYVDNLDDINYGCYIRWIKIKDPGNIKITNGGIICDMKIRDNGKTHIICKNNMNRFFPVVLEENLIFQKLTNQENILLNIIDYLKKNE